MPDRASSSRAAKITRIIACAVFKPALESLGLQDTYPNLRITYLPSHLHLKPPELENCLEKALTSAREAGEWVICLYGQCFPEIGRLGIAVDKQPLQPLQPGGIG